jgi:ornithine cyclodeaminase/alanine dehydrogenase
VSQLVYLSRADVAGLGIGMREVLAAVEEGFRLKGIGRTEMPAAPAVNPLDGAPIHAMPAHVEGVAAGVKWASGHPGNRAGLVVLNHPASGHPVAVMESTWITAMRTGASVGVAARHLARRHASTVAFVGCGARARTALAALVETVPDIAKVRCFDSSITAVAGFIDAMARGFPALHFVRCDTPQEVVRGADVLVTATPILERPQPFMQAGLLEQGGLAVSLDYDAAWTTAAMAECDRFLCDDIAQLRATKAQHVYFHGIPDVIPFDLGEVAAGKATGRQHDHERIFVMNVGLAVDDVVTARLVYDRAVAAGAGTRLPL